MKSFATRKSYTGIADLNVWFWIWYDTNYYTLTKQEGVTKWDFQEKLRCTASIEVVCQVLSVKTYQCDPLDVLAKPFDLSVKTPSIYWKLDLLRRYRHTVCWCETTVYPCSTSTGLRLHRKLLYEHYCNSMSTYGWHYASEICEGIFW